MGRYRCIIKSRLERAKKWLWFENIKKQYHCLVCKTKDFRVLDFLHHEEKQNLPVGQKNIGNKKNLPTLQLDI